MPVNVVCVAVSRLLLFLIKGYSLIWPIQRLPIYKVLIIFELFKLVTRETKEPFVARKPMRFWLAYKYQQVTLISESIAIGSGDGSSGFGPHLVGSYHLLVMCSQFGLFQFFRGSLLD